MFSIEVILFDGFDELDALGPYEVLRTAQENGADIHAELVGAHGAATITASHGARFIVDRGPSGGSDMVLVPGGGWNTRDGHRCVGRGSARRSARAARGDPQGRYHRRVGVHGRDPRRPAGITHGRSATTHHVAIDDLRASGAVIVDARVVNDQATSSPPAA